MKYIYHILNFILFGNIYVALGAVCLIQSTRIQLQHSDHFLSYSFLVFFATLFIYNFQRFFYKSQKDKSLNSIRRKWIFENQLSVKTLTFIGFVGVSIAYFFNDVNVLYYLAPLFILSLFYFSSFLTLRKSPFFKLFTLVVVWTMVTAVVPVLMGGEDPLATNNLMHFALRFCFMMAICIPFDIRDLQIDVVDNVSTLPHLIGEQKARLLAIGFIVLYTILIFPMFSSGAITEKIAIAMLVSALINSMPIVMSSSKRNEYFYVAWLDGTMLLQGLILIGADVFL